MDTMIWVQILDEVVFHFHANALGKNMNSSVLSPPPNVGQSKFFSLLVSQPVKEKENSDLKSDVLHLKNWLSGGVGWIYTFTKFFVKLSL